MNDVALGQFIQMIFLPYLSYAVGGLLAILVILVIFTRFRNSLPDTEIVEETYNG